MKTQNRWRYLSLCLFNSTAGAAFGQSRDGKVQEMLEAIQEKKEPENTSEEKVGTSIKTPLPALKNIFILKDSLQAGHGSIYQALICIDVRQCEPELCSLCQQDSSDADVPLDGAQARLEILKDNLLKRERGDLNAHGRTRACDRSCGTVSICSPSQCCDTTGLLSKNKFETLLKDTSFFCSTTWIAHSDTSHILKMKHELLTKSYF